ncbi:MAG: DUF4124 domain-containing protein [Steroidobacteraceae bacterium]
MRTAHLLLLAFAALGLSNLGLSSTASAGDVWKWVDAKGVTHYSDQPVPGATKVEVRAGNVADARSVAPVVSEPAPPPAAEHYRTLAIVQPQNGQSIINTAGQVSVGIAIEPALQPLHRLSLYLDGKAVTGFPRNTLSYALTEVPRGTHNVNAVVTDQSGKTILESSPVEFTVRQESIAQPPVGPSKKPPPKPQPRAGNKVLTTQPSYGALNGGHPAIDPATNRPVVKKPERKPGKP